MGLIRAAAGAVGGALADQWLEAIEADNMGQTTVCAGGVRVRYNDRRNGNIQGTADVISNGSVIQVYPNQFMLLTDGGKIVDYTAEPGYYRVDNSSQPSLFSGQFGEAVKNTWERFKFGGATPQSQKVYFINLQEIKGIKFGTPNALNYFDNFYNAELFLRAFGTYSIKIMDPNLFFAEALPRDQQRVDIEDINEQYLSEFLTALQSSINQMSVDGIRVSQVASKSMQLSQYMANVLDDDWRQKRGFVVQSVGIASISYDDQSKELINLRNQGAMLSDASIREGYVQGAVARGIENAGKNEAGAGAAFMGVGLGMNAAGNFMGTSSQANLQAMQMQQAARQGDPAVSASPAAPAAPQSDNRGGAEDNWFCGNCGRKNSGGRFCTDCGTPRPTPAGPTRCPHCDFEVAGPAPKFCPNCGRPFSD